MENVLPYLRELNMASMTLRILFAMLIGGLIGLDREQKQRAAGFRTYMLVALAAAATQILSQYLDLMLDAQWAPGYELVEKRTDVARLGAQIISGIGFLGTGTIMLTERQEVKGLTTASCLWASACMGLAIGAGFYECMVVGVVLIVLIMKLLPAFERNVLARSKNMNFYLEMDSIEDLSRVISYIKQRGTTIYDVELNKVEGGVPGRVRGSFSVHLTKRRAHTEILAAIAALEGVVAIEEI